VTEKKSRKEKLTARRREQIVNAAMEIFSQKGYEAATIPEIAEKAGVAAGTIYLYYPSKRELFVAVIKDFICTAPLLNLIFKIPKGDISAILKSIVKDRLNLVKNPAMARMPVLIGEVLRDPELKELWIKNFLHPFLAQIAPGYGLMATLGKFRRYDPDVAARLMGGLIIGFLMLKVMEGDASPLAQKDEDKIIEDIVNFMLHGLLRDTNKKEKDGKQ
jgi:AcrR family transcriptional regulator